MPDKTEDTITDRFAIGLARQAIRNWKDEVERSQKRLGGLILRELSTGKAARRLARDIAAASVPWRSVSQRWKSKSTAHTSAGSYPTSCKPIRANTCKSKSKAP
jgi:hypothetical protein